MFWRNSASSCPIAWAFSSFRNLYMMLWEANLAWQVNISALIAFLYSLEFGSHGLPDGNNSPTVIYKNNTQSLVLRKKRTLHNNTTAPFLLLTLPLMYSSLHGWEIMLNIAPFSRGILTHFVMILSKHMIMPWQERYNRSNMSFQTSLRGIFHTLFLVLSIPWNAICMEPIQLADNSKSCYICA